MGAIAPAIVPRVVSSCEAARMRRTPRLRPPAAAGRVVPRRSAPGTRLPGENGGARGQEGAGALGRGVVDAPRDRRREDARAQGPSAGTSRVPRRARRGHGGARPRAACHRGPRPALPDEDVEDAVRQARRTRRSTPRSKTGATERAGPRRSKSGARGISRSATACGLPASTRVRETRSPAASRVTSSRTRTTPMSATTTASSPLRSNAHRRTPASDWMASSPRASPRRHREVERDASHAIAAHLGNRPVGVDDLHPRVGPVHRRREDDQDAVPAHPPPAVVAGAGQVDSSRLPRSRRQRR